MVPPTNTCVIVARPPKWSATVALPRQPWAVVALAQRQGTTVVPRTYTCAVVVRPSGQSAAVAPKQSSANVAPLRWQHTIVVGSTCTCAAVARSSRHDTILALLRQPYAAVAPLQWQSAIVGPPRYTYRGATFGVECQRGATKTALRRRGASSMTRHHLGAVNVHVRCRGATFRAERHCGVAQTALHRGGASSVAERHRDAGNVHVHCRVVPFRVERRVVRPRQSCTDVAQADWQSTTVVPPPCACATMTRFSRASPAMLYSHGQCLRYHGGVCSWRCANLHDTPCRGDVSSAVLTASRVVGEPRRLARAQSSCHFLSHVPLRCRYCTVRHLASDFAAGVVGDLRGDAPPCCYGCDPDPALIEPGGTQATGSARDRVAWPYPRHRRYLARRQCA